MSRTLEKVKLLKDLINSGTSAANARKTICTDKQDWFRVSSKAYELHMQEAKRDREILQNKPSFICASNEDVEKTINLNHKLSQYALSMSPFNTMTDFKHLYKLSTSSPIDEHALITIIASATMCPRMRALQKKGRFEHFYIFKDLSILIESATLSYYRENYISSFLTLVPAVEGVLLRWSGHKNSEKKPQFDDLRKFFKNSHRRNPFPGNPSFHEVHTIACDKIINEHLFKPSMSGESHSDFNRHIAAHLLKEPTFATKDNCIRLFLLMDLMAEIFVYENNCYDPRFELSHQDTKQEICLYKSIIASSLYEETAEKMLLLRSIQSEY
ncbi:MAG: hypothetical protein V7765_17095 [Oleispira sp.]